MKKIKIITILLSSIFLFSKVDSFAQINIQNTAVPFMLISPDARSGGMGNLSLGMSPEANDLFGNTAKLHYLEEPSGFLINYIPWLKSLGVEDVYLATAGYYKKLNNNSSINTSLRFFSLGNIQFTDNSGSLTSEQRPSEFSYDFGYTVLVSDQFSVGATLRYIHSKLVTGSFVGNAIDYKAGNTVSADVSMFYKQNQDMQGFHAGLLLSNLGGKISYTENSSRKSFIPANIGLGVGYLTKFDADNSLEFGVDVNRLMVPVSPNINTSQADVDQYYSQSVISSWFNSFTNKYGMPLGESLKVSLGAEYNYGNRFYLRGGYFIDNNKNLGGSRQYFTLGTSFRYQQSKFNISYLVPSGGGGLNANPLANTLRFGSIFYL